MMTLPENARSDGIGGKGWSGRGEHRRCRRKGLAFVYLLMMGSLIINYRSRRRQIALSCNASSRRQKIDRSALVVVGGVGRGRIDGVMALFRYNLLGVTRH